MPTLAGDAPLLASAVGLNGQPLFGTLLAVAVLGALHASPAVKAALADRLH